MYQRYCLLITLLLLLAATSTTAQTTFQRYYANEVRDETFTINQTDDGGYFLASYEETFSIEANRASLVKLDANGDLLWAKEIVMNNRYFRIADAGETSDGGFVLTGNTSEIGANPDMLMIKTDASGTLQWAQTYDAGGSEFANYVEETSDGGYIMSGVLQAGTTASIYVVKTDAAGDTEWAYIYSPSTRDGAYVARETADGGYYLVGSGFVGQEQTSEMQVIKIDAAGDVEWARMYGNEGVADEILDAQITSDGGYVITGFLLDFVNGLIEGYVVKTENDGTIEWSKRYSNPAPNKSYRIFEHPDGGYTVSGLSSFHPGNLANEDGYLMRLDEDGEIDWAKSYGRSRTVNVYPMDMTDDGGYIITGFRQGEQVSQNGIYIVKTDENGTTICEHGGVTITAENATLRTTEPNVTATPNGTRESLQPTITGYALELTDVCAASGADEDKGSVLTGSLAPNPATAGTIVSLSLPPSAGSAEITLYDLAGRKVGEDRYDVLSGQAGTQVVIRTAGLPSGRYLIAITTGRGISHRILIIE